MKGWEQWRDVYSAEGQLLFAGLRAKVSVFHGQMTRIVPHTTTGKCHNALLPLGLCLYTLHIRAVSGH